MSLDSSAKKLLDVSLSRLGLRSTRQREQVFSVLLDKRDHPTADDVYARSRGGMPTISLATVYNCLETLVECGLVKQVNFDRESTRYCPNLMEHAHFLCEETGKVLDIPIPSSLMLELKTLLPEEAKVKSMELLFHGKVVSKTQ